MVLRGLWQRIVGRREASAVESAVAKHDLERGHERDHESFEDRQADRESPNHLGGDPGPR